MPARVSMCLMNPTSPLPRAAWHWDGGLVQRRQEHGAAAVHEGPADLLRRRESGRAPSCAAGIHLHRIGIVGSREIDRNGCGRVEGQLPASGCW